MRTALLAAASCAATVQPVMTTSALPSPSGAAMDRALPARRRRWIAPAFVAAAIAGAALFAGARAPRLQSVGSPQLVAVRTGEFRDEVALRARVEPLRSVQLDA